MSVKRTAAMDKKANSNAERPAPLPYSASTLVKSRAYINGSGKQVITSGAGSSQIDHSANNGILVNVQRAKQRASCYVYSYSIWPEQNKLIVRYTRYVDTAKLFNWTDYAASPFKEHLQFHFRAHSPTARTVEQVVMGVGTSLGTVDVPATWQEYLEQLRQEAMADWAEKESRSK